MKFCSKVAQKFSANYCKQYIHPALLDMASETSTSVLYAFTLNITPIRLSIKDSKLLSKLALQLDTQLKASRRPALRASLASALSYVSSPASASDTSSAEFQKLQLDLEDRESKI